MSDIEQKVFRRVIKQAINDLASDCALHRRSAEDYLRSDRFAVDCETAGYPKGLRDTLDEMLLLTKLEQKVIRKQLFEMLK